MIQKQSLESPLFPEIEWEAPQNIKQRGELLIVGGSLQGFASVANSFEYSKRAGIGRARVLMPEATKSSVAGFIDNIDFLPSTPSGSFAKTGLTSLKSFAQEAWGVLLAGEFGRNSETAALIEGFLMSTSGKIVLSKDAVDYAITAYPRPVLQRENTLLVLSLSQLQKLLKNAGAADNVRFEMSLQQTSAFLESLSVNVNAAIVTAHHKHLFVVVNGSVTVTPYATDEESLWQTRTAAYTATYWLQHETKPLEAITTAVYDSLRAH